MNENSEHQPEHELDAPPKLVAALKNVSQPEVFVPPYVDSAILKAARKHFRGTQNSTRGFLRYLRLWPAIVGSILVIVSVMIYLFIVSPTGRERGSELYAREDLNHDGKVDILDSFALARELKSGKRLPATYDVNGDGVVDQRDVILIATQAVQLHKDNGS